MHALVCSIFFFKSGKEREWEQQLRRILSLLSVRTRSKNFSLFQLDQLSRRLRRRKEQQHQLKPLPPLLLRFSSEAAVFSPPAAGDEAFTSYALTPPPRPPHPPILMRRGPFSPFFSFGTRTCSTPCSTSALSSSILAEGGRRTERDWKLAERSER